ncbi:arginase [Alteribacillus persepolensis]|uniref:Arginase n=1 Tax=Alteribacillus persepolensis TaxID=568899 RepID=A0A1G8CW54_9BACI|nr:arginase [Alteribacillus persepolensis]SDH49715.1 arginase [Alteribacillus persepolensis]
MNQNISMVGVPMDLGQNRRGVDMGPSAIRYAGVIERLEALGYRVEDKGDIAIEKKDAVKASPKNLSNLYAVTKANEKLAETVASIYEKNAFPLVIGGDHSIAIGTIAGASGYFENLGVIWYDAHGDLNTAQTSPSGNIHGMPLAVSLGMGHPSLTNIQTSKPKIKPENVVIIGARELDAGEKDYIRQSKMPVYTMHEVDRLGMSEVMRRAITYLEDKCDGVHLSLDLDGLDPHDAPGVGTPVIGGLSYRESHLAMEMLAESDFITSCEFVEVNPILDEKNRTAEAAVALMGSLFGEKLK